MAIFSPAGSRKEQVAKLQSQLPSKIGEWPIAGLAGGARLPIVYHPRYNISFGGIEKLHPFDSGKYGRVLTGLQDAKLLHKDQVLLAGIADDDLLLNVHTQAYLDTLNTSRVSVARVLELPLISLLPMALIRRQVMDPMRMHAAGTVLAAAVAMQCGWSINLGGGMHHAAPDVRQEVHALRTASGGGVCRVLVVDLDVHQGNGVGRCKLNNDDSDLVIADAYNGQIFPKDSAASTEEYLHGVETMLRDVATACEARPVDLIIYNAGTDVLDGDPLGRVHVSKEGVCRRDEMVFELALKLRTPVCMLMSGGYARGNWRVVLQSLTNLLTKYNLLPDRT